MDVQPNLTNEFSLIMRFLPIIIPVMLLQLGLMIGAIVSIAKRNERELRFNSKIIWILIVIFVNFLGPILYFILGTDDKKNNDSDWNNGGYDNGNYYNK